MKTCNFITHNVTTYECTTRNSTLTNKLWHAYIQALNNQTTKLDTDGKLLTQREEQNDLLKAAAEAENNEQITRSEVSDLSDSDESSFDMEEIQTHSLGRNKKVITPPMQP